MSGVPIRRIPLPGGRLFLVRIANLLSEPVDAIVNAANSGLSHGGGVAAAIAEAAGPTLEAACARILQERGRVPVGEAVVTLAGDLPFKAVIHAVGPRLGDGDEETKLIRAVQSALRRAAERGWRSVAFPAISAGVFAVPIPICARAYVRAVTDFFVEYPDASLREVRVCLFQGPLEEAVAVEVEKVSPGPSPIRTQEDSEPPVYASGFWMMAGKWHSVTQQEKLAGNGRPMLSRLPWPPAAGASHGRCHGTE